MPEITGKFEWNGKDLILIPDTKENCLYLPWVSNYPSSGGLLITSGLLIFTPNEEGKLRLIGIEEPSLTIQLTRELERLAEKIARCVPSMNVSLQARCPFSPGLLRVMSENSEPQSGSEQSSKSNINHHPAQGNRGRHE